MTSLLVHLASAILFAAGIFFTIRKEGPQPNAISRIISFGPMFFAVPLAVFGIQHFTATNVVVGGVPPWMPWRLFWVYFVGLALIAASLSIITRIKADLAALLVGIMLFLFVLMIYVPSAVRHPHERLAWVLVCRDLSLSGGGLSLAGVLLTNGRLGRVLAVIGRYFFAIPIILFGGETFLYPDLAPGVPLPQVIPAWIPGHALCAYLSGIILVISGLSIAINNKPRASAVWAGTTLCVLVVLIYTPLAISNPSIEISGSLDYVADTLAEAGAALLVARAAEHFMKTGPHFG